MSLHQSNSEAQLVLIGCGTPTPTPDRFGSCLVFRKNNEYLMFDCGPASTYKMVRAGITPTQVTHLFFTHHHYDHNGDYACFLLCRWDHERKGIRRLRVFGPKPTKRITQRLIGPDGAFVDDWRARVEHPASQEVYAARGGQIPRPAPDYDIKEISKGSVIHTDHCTVTAGRAVHLEPMLECIAYRIDWDNGSLVVTGDTGRHPDMIQLARGATTLVVNVWDHQDNMSPTLQSGFCGTLDAARIAEEADVQRLVVTHQGPNLSRPGSREKGVADMASIFNGEIIFGEEFLALDLDR